MKYLGCFLFALALVLCRCSTLRPLPPEKIETLRQAVQKNDGEIFQRELPNQRFNDLYYYDQMNFVELLKLAASKGKNCNLTIVGPLLDSGAYIPGFMLREDTASRALCPRVAEATFVRGTQEDRYIAAVLVQNVFVAKINSAVSQAPSPSDMDHVAILAPLFHSIHKTLDMECTNGQKSSCTLAGKYVKTLEQIELVVQAIEKRGAKTRELASALEEAVDSDQGVAYARPE
ncbi:MAG: hypothetical protein HY537_11865 [Deltaproteobacteria bacterium]|nr:hypothetical protein [Deltaproteobacteria bacterium]